jgi:hypothetical protein
LNRYRKIFETTDKEEKYFLSKTILRISQMFGTGIRDPEKSVPDPDPNQGLKKNIGSPTPNPIPQHWI